MVEVFKTNVVDGQHAKMLIMEIHKVFEDYEANFDLDDCDRILRIKSSSQHIPAIPVILLMKQFGFHAEVLPDDAVSFDFSSLLPANLSGS